MTDLTVTPFKILICFAFVLITTISARFLLKDKRDLWFRRSQSKNIITIRGKIGEYLALGYPICLEGFAVTALLLAVIAIEILFVLYLNI